MILSEQHRFLFVKGKKVAGTSLELVLAAVCGPRDIITPITPIDERQRIAAARRGPQNYGADPKALENYMTALQAAPQARLGDLAFPKGRYFNHMSLVEVERLYGPIPEDWVVFGVERDPYRKIISLANMELRFADYKRTGAAMKSSVEDLKRQLDRLIDSGGIASVRNIGQYRDLAGRMRVELLRYEHLADDVARLMARLGIASWPPLPHLKAGMSSNALDPRELLSPRQLAVVNAQFAEEFEAFGYQMIS